MGLPLASTRSQYSMTSQEAANGINGHAADAAESSAAASPSQMTADQARSRALELGHQRAAIDDELHSLGQTLQSQNATMHSPLVDADGFPLANIDLVAVRTARARIIALRNDRNAVEAQMRELINVALARPEASASGSSAQAATSRIASAGQAMAQVPGSSGALSMSVPTRQEGDADSWASVGGLQPFARVNTVASQSPAAQAGLQVDDEILQFGHLDSTSANRNTERRDLANLPSAVQEGVEIQIMVLRKQTASAANGGRNGVTAGTDRSVSGGVIKRLRLTPATNWGGRGLLGCHLLAL